MSEQHDRTGEWTECPEGELRAMVQRQKAQHRNAQMIKLGSVAAMLLVFVVAGSLLVDRLTPRDEHGFGGIGCSDVQAMMAEYAAGTLDAKTAQRVKQHLDACPHCEQAYRQMINARAGQSESPAAKWPQIAMAGR